MTDADLKAIEARLRTAPITSWTVDVRRLIAEVKQCREVFANDCLADSLADITALRLAHRTGQEVMLKRIVSALKENNLDTTALLVSKVEAIDP